MCPGGLELPVKDPAQAAPGLHNRKRRLPALELQPQGPLKLLKHLQWVSESLATGLPRLPQGHTTQPHALQVFLVTDDGLL